MKKILIISLLFSMFVFLFVDNVHADEIKSFTCTYTVQTTANTYKEFKKANFDIVMEATKSDSGDNKWTVSLKYKNQAGEQVKLDSDASGVKDVDSLNGVEYVDFFPDTDNGFDEYIKRFDGSACPVLYLRHYAQDLNNYTIENTTLSSNGEGEALSGKILINGNQTMEEYVEENYTGEKLEETECTYMLSFSNISGSKEFKVVKSPNVSTQKYSYKFFYDGKEITVADNLEEAHFEVFSGYSANINGTELKKIAETSKCYEKLYTYLDVNNNFNITTDKQEAEENAQSGVKESDEPSPNAHVPGGPHNEDVELDIGTKPMSCENILGPVLTKIVKYAITIIQIAAAIIAIVKGMLILVPAVVAKDGDGLKKAGRTLVILGIILAVIIVFRPVVRLIGKVLEYDISCII